VQTALEIIQENRVPEKDFADLMMVLIDNATDHNEEYELLNGLQLLAKSNYDSSEEVVRFIIDSAATLTVSKTLNQLINIKDERSLMPRVGTAGGAISADAIGDLDAFIGRNFKKNLILAGLYLKDSPCNVISVKQLNEQGYKARFDDGDPHLLCPPSSTGLMEKIKLGVCPKTGLYFVDVKLRPTQLGQLIDQIMTTPTFEEVSMPTGVDMQRLHERLGHPNMASMRHIPRTTHGFNLRGSFNLPSCSICDAINLERSSYPMNSSRPVSTFELGECIHSDLHGPMRVQSMTLAGGKGGNFYWISFIDDKSRKGWIHFLRQKSETPRAVSKMLSVLQSFNRKMKVFVCDQDRVYLSKECKDIIERAGARIHNSPVYTGAGNAVAESFNAQIELRTVANLRTGGAPKDAWELAAAYASDQRNVLRINSQVHPELQDSSPDEQWYDGIKPNIEFFRVFWSTARPLDHSKFLGTLEPEGRAKEGIFVYIGPATRSDGFNLLDLKTGKFYETVHATINEDMSHRVDQITNLKLNLLKPDNVWGGADNADMARRIDDSFDMTRTQTLDIEGSVWKAPLGAALSEEHIQSNTDIEYTGDDEKFAKELKNLGPTNSYPSDAELRIRKRVNERETIMHGRQPSQTDIDTRLQRDRREINNEHRAFLKQIFDIDGQIRFQQTNPKKKKSRERYDAYKAANTLRDVIKKGGSWGDIYNDYARGFLRVAVDLEAARLNSDTQNVVSLSKLEVTSPWTTWCPLTASNSYECLATPTIIKPILPSGTPVQLHHFVNDSYIGAKGFVIGAHRAGGGVCSRRVRQHDDPVRWPR